MGFVVGEAVLCVLLEMVGEALLCEMVASSGCLRTTRLAWAEEGVVLRGWLRRTKDAEGIAADAGLCLLVMWNFGLSSTRCS